MGRKTYRIDYVTINFTPDFTEPFQFTTKYKTALPIPNKLSTDSSFVVLIDIGILTNNPYVLLAACIYIVISTVELTKSPLVSGTTFKNQHLFVW